LFVDLDLSDSIWGVRWVGWTSISRGCVGSSCHGI